MKFLEKIKHKEVNHELEGEAAKLAVPGTENEKLAGRTEVLKRESECKLTILDEL